ncbi:MAG: Sua5/YciO/YrdC/YwlC family protein, partial [Chloroflexota bacterium]
MDTSPLEQAKAVLRRGEVVAIPTDTVYGLAAGAYDEAAVAKVFRIKHRPAHLPLPLLLANSSQMAEVSSSVSPLAWHLARRFLPGGLTLILHKAKHISPLITAGGDT